MTSARGQPALDTATHAARPWLLIDVPPRAPEVAAARHAVGAFLRERAVPSTVVDDLELVTSELVTNAIIHPDPSDHPVHVVVQAGESVTIEVANHGSIGGIPAVGHWRTAAPPEASGRGLGIVRRLCDRVDVRQEGEWAVIACRRRVPDAPRHHGPTA